MYKELKCSLLFGSQYRFSQASQVSVLLFSGSVMFYSLWPYGLQHSSLSCPSVPRTWSNSCPLSRWRHPTISSFLIPFSCLQSFPESGSFLMSWLFTSGGESIGASTSASVLLRDIQDSFPWGLTGWISLQSKGFSSVFSITTVQKHQFFRTQPSLWSNSHQYMTTGKTIAPRWCKW